MHFFVNGTTLCVDVCVFIVLCWYFTNFEVFKFIKKKMEIFFLASAWIFADNNNTLYILFKKDR